MTEPGDIQVGGKLSPWTLWLCTQWPGHITIEDSHPRHSWFSEKHWQENRWPGGSTRRSHKVWTQSAKSYEYNTIVLPGWVTWSHSGGMGLGNTSLMMYSVHCSEAKLGRRNSRRSKGPAERTRAFLSVFHVYISESWFIRDRDRDRDRELWNPAECAIPDKPRVLIYHKHYYDWYSLNFETRKQNWSDACRTTSD
jgi:hypothetical protein